MPKDLFTLWFFKDRLEATLAVDAMFTVGGSYVRGGVCDGVIIHLGPFMLGFYFHEKDWFTR